jgi:hypothetical protein
VVAAPFRNAPSATPTPLSDATPMIFEFLDRCLTSVMHFLVSAPFRFNSEQWLLVFVALVMFGFLCMRGMADRRI